MSGVRGFVSMAVLGSVMTVAAVAQTGRVYTTADYAQAEKFMNNLLEEMVMHKADHPTWMADNRFWYGDQGETAMTYMLVDPAKGTKVPAFDQVKLVAAINAMGARAGGPPVGAVAGQVTAGQVTTGQGRSGQGEVGQGENGQGGSGVTATRTVTTSDGGGQAGAAQTGAGQAGVARGGRGGRGGTAGQAGDGQGGPPVKLDPAHLKVTEMSFSDGDKTVSVTIAGRSYKCDLSGAGSCTMGGGRAAGGAGGPGGGGTSPDGKKAIFSRDYNLWLRDVATGRETQLTTDGVKDYAYGGGRGGGGGSWSPDSRKFATTQVDERRVKDMYLVPVVLGHPDLTTIKYPLAGDPVIRSSERVIVDADSHKVVRVKAVPDGSGGGGGVQWNDDSLHFAFLSQTRDFHQVWLRVADAETGEVRQLLTETVPTFFESAGAGGGGGGAVGGVRRNTSSWRYLPATNEIVWFSERDNWGNLYLYDLTSGKVKNQITHGDGNVRQIIDMDTKGRVIYFMGVGKEKGWDPYLTAFYKVNFDGSGLQLLTPEKGEHTVVLSPNGLYYSDIYSTAVEPEKGAIHELSGKVAVELPNEDISKLKAIGWVPPTPIMVKARDGKTDLYGYMFKPTSFDAKKKYPIVNNVYPGPQIGSCRGGRNFLGVHGAPDMQSLAELGFITVCIDGMGTPTRSKSFHDARYGEMGDNTIPDQIAAMKELAAKDPWIDLDRVGIWGHSGGGAATASAMFHYPDFFKVGISESGNHDNRNYEDNWGEKYLGLEVKDATGKDNYDSQANEDFAKNLKGHLMLLHGTMDDNVAPNNTLLVVAALIKANKDFDLLMIPNRPHAYGPDANYVVRRRWDYFVRYLAGGIPAHEYQMKPSPPVPEPGVAPDGDDDPDEIVW